MENGSTKIGLRVTAGLLVAITIIVAVFASGISLPTFESKTGRLTVLLMDAPVDLERLMVTLNDLEVHQVGVGEDEGAWIKLIENKEIEFDLLVYQNGATLNLASEEITAASYNKIRMNVSEAWAHYKQDTEEADENPVELKVPSGKIDVIIEFELVEGESKVVTIDMEPDWIHIKNNNFRPVLKVIESEEAAGQGEQAT